MQEKIIGVEGMSCHHCKNAVEEEIKSLDGVFSAEASLEKNQVEVSFDESKVCIEEIYEAIEEAGYEFVKI